jgi:hypothetical protein
MISFDLDKTNPGRHTYPGGVDEDFSPTIVALEFSELYQSYRSASVSCSNSVMLCYSESSRNNLYVQTELFDAIKNGFKRLWEAIKKFFRAIKNWMFGQEKTTKRALNTIHDRIKNKKLTSTNITLSYQDENFEASDFKKAGPLYDINSLAKRYGGLDACATQLDGLTTSIQQLLTTGITDLELKTTCADMNKLLGINLSATDLGDFVKFIISVDSFENVLPLVVGDDALNASYKNTASNWGGFIGLVNAADRCFDSVEKISHAVAEAHVTMSNTFNEEKSIMRATDKVQSAVAKNLIVLKSRMDLGMQFTQRFLTLTDSLVTHCETIIALSNLAKAKSVSNLSPLPPAAP